MNVPFGHPHLTSNYSLFPMSMPSPRSLSPASLYVTSLTPLPEPLTDLKLGVVPGDVDASPEVPVSLYLSPSLTSNSAWFQEMSMLPPRSLSVVKFRISFSRASRSSSRVWQRKAAL